MADCTLQMFCLPVRQLRENMEEKVMDSEKVPQCTRKLLSSTGAPQSRCYVSHLGNLKEFDLKYFFFNCLFKCTICHNQKYV